jgi:hypothetical protein
MARISDGRMGVSVNPETIKVLDEVRTLLREQMGINASYTQAIQYVANQYIKDNVTASHSVPTQGE